MAHPHLLRDHHICRGTKRSQQIAGQLTGALPFCVGVYWYTKLGNDLFQILSYGAFLSLAFGAALFILPRKSK